MYKNIKHIRIVFCLALAVGYLALWLIPSNIESLIVRDKDILLGRYSLERMTLLLFFPIMVAPIIYLLFAQHKKALKIRTFQIIVILITFIPGLFIADLILRIKNQTYYVETNKGFHRPPNQKYELVIHDKPEKSGKFQQNRSGYPDIPCTLTVDSMGFRNVKDYDTCDIIAIGDSFVEGSHVSDPSPWPVLLSKLTKKTVCNLGVSGTDPLEYLDRFEKVGIQKKPSILICMIYEGNDFLDNDPLEQRLKALKHGHSRAQTFSRRLRRYKKTSPVIRSVRQTMIDLLTLSSDDVITSDSKLLKNQTEPGSTSTDSNGLIGKGISWLPIKIPDNENGKYYNFPPKRMLRLYHQKDEFVKSNGWRSAEYALRRMKEICDKKSIRMIVVLAPSKPDVLLPLIRDRISPEILHAFAVLKDSSIPSTEIFSNELFENINVICNTIQGFCEKNKIEFIDTSKTLRDKMKNGIQVYFTYDQHWTPPGHQAVATVVAETVNDKK